MVAPTRLHPKLFSNSFQLSRFQMFFSIPFQENDFACGRTCIFGLDADEHEALKTVGEVAPRVFTEGDVIPQTTSHTHFVTMLLYEILGGRFHRLMHFTVTAYKHLIFFNLLQKLFSSSFQKQLKNYLVILFFLNISNINVFVRKFESNSKTST